MLIYKDGKVADYKEFFKDTSFPVSGPSDSFLAEQGAVKVNLWKPHDQDTEKLVSCDPYLEDGWAYTVQVEPKTQEEIDSQNESFNAKQRQGRADAYAQEADPLFFKWQRGEATKEEWLAKVEEIKARFAYIE
jgi:predicted ATPase